MQFPWSLHISINTSASSGAQLILVICYKHLRRPTFRFLYAVHTTSHRTDLYETAAVRDENQSKIESRTRLIV